MNGQNQNTQHLEQKRKKLNNQPIVIIKSSDLLNMLDDQSIEYLSYKDLNSLCVMASIEIQLDYESQSTSNRGNLC